MMRFHFSTSKIVIKYLFIKDSISNHTAIILIVAMVLLLGIYSFVAYSFLENTSSLLIEDYSSMTSTIPNQKNKQTNPFFLLHDKVINGNTLEHNEVINLFSISAFFENSLEQILKDQQLLTRKSILCISEKIIETDSYDSFQKNNKTVS